MPYADEGHLGKHIASMKKDYETANEEELTEENRKRLSVRRTKMFQWMICLVRTIFDLHGLGIRHCDIKSENVLVKRGDVFLADFGIAFSTKDPTGTGRTTVVGTARYMPPEADAKETDGQANMRKCGMPGDIWSLGCLFYEMMYVMCLAALSHAWEHEIRRSPESEDSGWIESSYATYKQNEKQGMPFTLYSSGELMRYDTFKGFIWWRMLHLEESKRANAYNVLEYISIIEDLDSLECCQVEDLTKIWKDQWVTGVAGELTGAKASDIDPEETEDL